MYSRQRLKEILPYLTGGETCELDRLLLEGVPLWIPQPGPQTEAQQSLADITGYGGAAGGGKTDLGCGLALTQHTRSIIFRKEATQLGGVIDRIEEIRDTRQGFNSQTGIWRFDDGRRLQFGGLKDANSHKKYQGIAQDLKVFDETTELPEYQVRFLMGWERTSDAKQRTRVLMTFNPPTDVAGRWVIDYFAPWLDPKHPNPAAVGELRWYTTVKGVDHEVPDGTPIEVDGETVQPLSRTFIPARVEDNVYYMESGYKSRLQALPEPLRSQMLLGDFMAGVEDDVWQVIPTAWVEAAQARWKPLTTRKPMDSMGVDVARGGKDKTVISRRHGEWYDKLLRHPGTTTPDGPVVAGLVIAARRDKSPIHIDVVGVGASPYDFLKDIAQTIPVAGSAGTKDEFGVAQTAQEGVLLFLNMRSMIIWRMREALDPANGRLVALPPDEDGSTLLKDLTCYRWTYGVRGIQIESKDAIIDRLKHSPDDGDAVCYAGIDTPREDDSDVVEIPYESEFA